MMNKIFTPSTLLVVNAVLTLLGGLSQLFIPEQWVGNFIPSIDAGGAFVAQFMGIVVIGMAAISFLSRNVKDQTALNAILIGFIITHAGSLFLVIYGMNAGLMSQEGFADIVVHGFFATSFTYFLFKKKTNDIRTGGMRRSQQGLM